MKRVGQMLMIVMMIVVLSAVVKIGADGRDFIRGTGDPDEPYGEGKRTFWLG